MFPDGVGFYPDTKDGVRGYNTDAARGADTFRPFNMPDIKVLRVANPLGVTLSCDALVGREYIIVVVAIANWWGGWNNQNLNLSGASVVKNNAVFQVEPYNPNKSPVGNTMILITTVKATASTISIRPDFGHSSAVNGVSMIV